MHRHLARIVVEMLSLLVQVKHFVRKDCLVLFLKALILLANKKNFLLLVKRHFSGIDNIYYCS